MPIFIAKTYEGKIESLVLAKSYELAQAYWQGQGITVHSTDEESEIDLIDHITGVLPIIKTKKRRVKVGNVFDSNSKEILVISND